MTVEFLIRHFVPTVKVVLKNKAMKTVAIYYANTLLNDSSIDSKYKKASVIDWKWNINKPTVNVYTNI